MLEENCNDIPLIDSSAILWVVSYIPSDHELGSGDDHDDEERIDEQNEKNVFTFSFDDEDSWKGKNICNCLFYSIYEKILLRFRVTIQNLFIISDNLTFEKEKFLNYKKSLFMKIVHHEKFENSRFAKISVREIFGKGWFAKSGTRKIWFFWPREN